MIEFPRNINGKTNRDKDLWIDTVGGGERLVYFDDRQARNGRLWSHKRGIEIKPGLEQGRSISFLIYSICLSKLLLMKWKSIQFTFL